MSDTTPTSNAKIYPRPEKTAPSPVLIVISLMVVMLLSIVAYRAFTHQGSAPQSQGNVSTDTGSQQRQMPLVDKRP